MVLKFKLVIKAVYYSSTLLLINVFYIPDLTCHLISISQLLQQHPSYHVKIANNTCVIQDLTTKRRIGAADRLINGVYRFSQL